MDRRGQEWPDFFSAGYFYGLLTRVLFARTGAVFFCEFVYGAISNERPLHFGRS
jgi:hypothetical protein